MLKILRGGVFPSPVGNGTVGGMPPLREFFHILFGSGAFWAFFTYNSCNTESKHCCVPIGYFILSPMADVSSMSYIHRLVLVARWCSA